MNHNPIRTLHIETAEDGTTGGSHRSLHDLVSGLVGLGVSPTVLFYEDNAFVPRLRDKGIDVRVWQRSRQEEVAAFGRLPSSMRLLPVVRHFLRRSRFLKDQAFDLIHLNNSPFTGHTDWLPAALTRGIPCVASMRGDATEPVTARQRAIFRFYSKVVPVSHYVSASPTCQAIGHPKVEVIPNGVDLDRLQVARLDATEVERTRRRLGVSVPQQFLAVMAGTIRRWKGQLNVVHALTHLRPHDLARLKLVFVGGWGPRDEGYVQEVRSLVREQGLSEHVQLLGHRRDVPQLFSAADVAIHNSTTHEPFGLVVVEALAMGTPVLAAKGGGPVEIIHRGGGLLHDPHQPQKLADHLSLTLNDPGLRIRLSEEAERVADRYSIENTRRRMARLYHSLLARPFPEELERSA